MKRKNKVVLTSMATIALCSSLLVGGTYALFTSESKVNVAVTSGTVSMVASVKDGSVKTYSGAWDSASGSYVDVEQTAGAFANGGSATVFQDSNTVQIDRITPMDKVEFEIEIVNNSNVTVQYQTKVELIEGVDLFSALEISIDGKTYDGMTAYSNWETLVYDNNDESEVVDTIKVSIALPDDENNNDVQGKSVKLAYTVNAVQGNAHTEAPEADENTLYIYNANDMKLFANSVNKGNTFAGKTVKLMSNVDLENEEWTPIGNSSNKFQGTFDGNGKTVSNLYVEGGKGLGLFGYVYSGAYIHDLTIDGAYVSGYDYLGAVVGTGYFSQNGVQNCVVKNAEIIATPYLTDDGIYDGGAKAGAVAGYVINGNVCGNSAADSSVSAYRDLGGIVGMVSGENRAVVAENNSVKNVTLTYLAASGDYDGGKVNQNMDDIVGRKSNVTVENNTASSMTYNMADGLKYASMENGGLILFDVTGYTAETLNVPQGVTALRNKLLNGNTTIKEVTIPSTLTDFGGTPYATGTGASGGFFYNSAVEKITLPEGLTEIPAAAFNQAANLKEVNIPSSVTTIGINAFAGSGLETLTIPDSVTSIGYGAFRDMASLTTVTIEGDEVSIPDYAFRACADLTTIYMNVNKLTLGDNMIFTNTSTNNENPNNITIYVKNDEVYNTLTSNANVKCTIVKVGEIEIADSTNPAAADEALLAGGVVVLDEDVTYSANDTTANSGYKGATGLRVTDGAILDGNGNTLTVTDANTTWACAINAHNGTIKNLTVTGAFRGIFMSGASGDVYIDNVIIDGTVYTFNSDAGSKDYGVYISNSTLNGWTSFSDAHKEVVFTNCKFGEGRGNAFCRPYNASVFENCVFEEGFEFDTGRTSEIVFKNCYYGDTLITGANAATLGNGETTFFYNGLNGITINGAKATNASSDKELSSALTSSSSVAVTLSDGEYTMPSVSNGEVAISGTEDTVITIDKPNYSGSDVTLNGVTVKGSGYSTGIQHVNTVTYNEVTIVGEMCLYGEKVVFNNCTFELNGQYVWTYGAKEVEFNGCTFNTTGKAILVYNEGAGASKVTVKGCTFNATAGATAGAIANQNCAAIEIDNYKNMAHVLITEGNTYSENFSGEWRIKNYVSGSAVTVNGVEYTSIAIDGKTMTIDESKNVTVNE